MIVQLIIAGLALYGLAKQKAERTQAMEPRTGPVQLQAQAQSSLTQPQPELTPETHVFNEQSYALAFRLPVKPQISETGISAPATSPPSGGGGFIAGRTIGTGRGLILAL